VKVLYCHCAFAKALPGKVRRAALKALLASGRKLEAVRDLCELAARKDKRLKRWAAAKKLIIAACHPRAVRCLFAAAGAPLRAGQATFVNLRALTPGQAARALGQGDGASSGADVDGRLKDVLAELESIAPQDWIPWFPVIDQRRCRRCGKCLNFCLFGVYERAADGAVVARNPANCKTNCPACARVCPQGAIIFPKYRAAPINGGEARATEPVAVDLATLMEGDALGFLQRRQERERGLAASSGGSATDLLEALDVPRELRREVLALAGAKLGARPPAEAGRRRPRAKRRIPVRPGGTAG